MRQERTIFIGDVHGCIDELQELVRKVGFDHTRDRIIMVGDLVDRGPDSAGVVRFVRNQGFDCVAGNHDNKLGRFFKHEQKVKLSKKKYKNPMRLRDDKRAAYDALTTDELRWLVDLPNFIYLGESNTLVVHAGVQPGREPLGQPGNVYRHIRYVNEQTYDLEKLDTTTFAQPKGSKLWGELYNGSLTVVHGHHVGNLTTPQVHTNSNGGRVIGIDTGCCFGGKLTAWIFNTDGSDDCVQVDAKKVHYSR